MDVAVAARAAAFWAGLHLLLLLVLSVVAAQRRSRLQIGPDAPAPPALARAVAAFSNASEYAPAALIAILALTVVGAPAALVHLAGASLFAGRVVQAGGHLHDLGASALRSLGMLITWVAYLGAAVSLLFFAIP